MSDELTPAEVAAATGKRNAAAQAAVLAKRGVPFAFVGHAVRVVRAVAEAHAIAPQRPAGGVNFGRVR